MKKCCRCKNTKPFAEFYKNAIMKDGLHSFCIVCHRVDGAARKKRNREDPEFRAVERVYKKQYRDKTKVARKVYMRAWYLKNHAAQTAYRAGTAEKRSAYGKEYLQKNRAKVLARVRVRQAARIQRTPAWLCEDDFFLMEEAYALAELRTKVLGFKWHVDHIIPLQGKLVSGLHVPENLRVIPARENFAKNNRFEVC